MNHRLSTTGQRRHSRTANDGAIRVYGIVQGVFFRKNTVLKGRELGLRGWCMNTSEGTVRGAMEGQAGKVAEMKYWLQNSELNKQAPDQ
ncbi:unnamed protein product [Timema podura]|uniref:Acylphosphatase n=1 Tax=Timema podura TaxID=61482 RepID=A0ABN7NWC4_TIMPD|nr:unnamed protein product [Timema podura]